MSPTKSRVILTPVSQDDADKKTNSGLYLPRAVTDSVKFVEGTVLAIGPEVTQIKAGDSVLYAREHGNFLTNGAGIEVILIESEHISVVL